MIYHIYLEEEKIIENRGDKFRFGFNIANIGPPITFIDEAQADPAPTNMRLGFFSNLYEDEFTRFNMMMDMQKLLVAKYPSMDWNGDRIIGDGPGGNSFNNSAGQNENAYAVILNRYNNPLVCYRKKTKKPLSIRVTAISVFLPQY